MLDYTNLFKFASHPRKAADVINAITNQINKPVLYSKSKESCSGKQQ